MFVANSHHMKNLDTLFTLLTQAISLSETGPDELIQFQYYGKTIEIQTVQNELNGSILRHTGVDIHDTNSIMRAHYLLNDYILENQPK